MPESDLNTLLVTLHQELSSASDVDEPTRQLLKTVAADIASVLDQDSGSAGQQDKESDVGSHTLKQMAVEFEAEHPRLARTLNEVADSLARIGI